METLDLAVCPTTSEWAVSQAQPTHTNKFQDTVYRMDIKVNPLLPVQDLRHCTTLKAACPTRLLLQAGNLPHRYLPTLSPSLSRPHRLDLDISAHLPMELDLHLYLSPYPSPPLGRTPTRLSRRFREHRATSFRLWDRRYAPPAATLGSRVDLGLMGIADSAGLRSVASTAPPARGEPAVRTLVAE
jgi:hypothetical protein